MRDTTGMEITDALIALNAREQEFVKAMFTTEPALKCLDGVLDQMPAHMLDHSINTNKTSLTFLHQQI